MAETNILPFYLATVLTGLLLLRNSYDNLNSKAIMATRNRTFPLAAIVIFIVILECKELMVIVAALAQGRLPLAMGCVLGAAISNMLAHFPMALLLFDEGSVVRFDSKTQTYAFMLLISTICACLIIYYPAEKTRVVDIFETAVAGLLYGLVAAWRHQKTSPRCWEFSSSSSSGSDSDSEDDITPESITGDDDHVKDDARVTMSGDLTPERNLAAKNSNPLTSLLRSLRISAYCSGSMIYAFIAMSLSGFVLSQAAAIMAHHFGISEVMLGVVIVAISPALPEHVVHAMGGLSRPWPDTSIANCICGNFFLLVMCIGISMADTTGSLRGENVPKFELLALYASTLWFTLTICLGAKFGRWVGFCMLIFHATFILLELGVIHRVVE